MVYRNNAGRLGFGFISVCLETRWLGPNSGFYAPERPCTTEIFQDAWKRSLQPRDGNVILTILGQKKRHIQKQQARVPKKHGLSLLLRQRHGHPQTSSSMGQPWQVEEASLVSFSITWCTFETNLVNMGLSRCNWHAWNRADVTRVAPLGPDTNTTTPRWYQHLISFLLFSWVAKTQLNH